MPIKTIKRTIRRKTPVPPSSSLPPGTSEAILHTTQRLSGVSPMPADEMADWLSGAGAAHLSISSPGQPEFKVPLSRREVTIGRDKDCRICLPLVNISRIHARIVIVGEEYRLEDLNSTNGTFVNGVRVSRCVLRDNDQVRVGEARIAFVQQRIKDTR